MATRNIVPRANGEGSIGTAVKHWGNGYFDELNTDLIAPPSGSTNNSVGAVDRKWKEGYFEKLPNWQEYLAESTGYGIVSGCEPTINNLTVTVGAGVVHLADGTRKEIAETNVTLDAADSTNPRIDLVYIDSTGTVAKVTGTAAASPSAPALPTGGISVAQVTVAAGATTGNINNYMQMLANKAVYSLADFPGETNEDRLHNALSTITEGTLYCGKINVTKSFDVASNTTDYTKITLVGANITINSVPMFVSSKPDVIATVVNSVPSFSNCNIVGNNNTTFLGDFYVITTKFDSCKIYSCPLFNSNTHAMQSLYLNNTDIRYLNTVMVTALRLYNLNVANCRIEHCTSGIFDLLQKNGNSIVNGAITNTLIENIDGIILKTAGGYLPLVIQNCYFEANAYPMIKVTGSNSQVKLYIKGCYFNIETITADKYVIELNGANAANVLIEQNVFSKLALEENTICITNIISSEELSWLKMVYNTFNYAGKMVLTMGAQEEWRLRDYPVTVEDELLVVTIPLGTKTGLYLQHVVIDIDFFGKLNTSDPQGIGTGYIHAKYALFPPTDVSGVGARNVFEFKSRSDLSITATVINQAYYSQNSYLKISFGGFDTTNYQRDRCYVNNNRLMSLWEK
jgi:hypothetical protein